MEKKQNGHVNHGKSGKQSNLETTKGGRKKETDPNNPTANKSKQQNSQQGSQQRPDSNSSCSM